MRRVFRQRSVLIEYSEPRRTLMLSPCSRLSRPSPGGRAKCAALTATPLVGGYDVRAGTEGWAPQGPNKRMRSEEKREAVLAACLQVGACSRLGEMRLRMQVNPTSAASAVAPSMRASKTRRLVRSTKVPTAD